VVVPSGHPTPELGTGFWKSVSVWSGFISNVIMFLFGITIGLAKILEKVLKYVRSSQFDWLISGGRSDWP